MEAPVRCRERGVPVGVVFRAGRGDSGSDRTGEPEAEEPGDPARALTAGDGTPMEEERASAITGAFGCGRYKPCCWQQSGLFWSYLRPGSRGAAFVLLPTMARMPGPG